MAKKAVFGSKRHGYNAMQKKQQRRATAMQKTGSAMGWFFRCGIFFVIALAGFVYGLQQGEKNWKNMNPFQGNILKNIEVSGNYMLAREEVIMLSLLDSGMQMDSIVEDSIKEKLQADSRILEAKVEKKFPSKVLLEINEARPLMSAYESGRWVVYSEKGSVLPLSRKTAYQLPVITAKTKNERMLCASFLRKLYEMDSLLFKKISQVSVSHEEQGIEVFFNDVSYKTLFALDSSWNADTFAGYRQMVKNFDENLSETSILDMRFSGFAFIRKKETRRKNG